MKNKKLSAFLSTGIARPPKGFCLCRGGSTRLSPQDCARPWQLQTLIFCSNLPTYPLFSEVMEKDFPCRVPVFTVITLVISAGTRATALILQGSCISHGSQLLQFSVEKTMRCEQQWQQNSLWGSTFWLPVAVL